MGRNLNIIVSADALMVLDPEQTRTVPTTKRTYDNNKVRHDVFLAVKDVAFVFSDITTSSLFSKMAAISKQEVWRVKWRASSRKAHGLAYFQRRSLIGCHKYNVAESQTIDNLFVDVGLTTINSCHQSRYCRHKQLGDQ